MKRKTRIMGVSLVAALAAPSFALADAHNTPMPSRAVELGQDSADDLASTEALLIDALRQRMLGPDHS